MKCPHIGEDDINRGLVLCLIEENLSELGGIENRNHIYASILKLPYDRDPISKIVSVGIVIT